MVNGNKKKKMARYIIGINLFFIATSAMYSANLSGIFFKIGLRKIIKIPNILKNKCANAATIAVTLRVNEANNAVTVVPRLAPNVKGYNCLSVTTPAPAKGTIVEGVIDELWTMMVRIIPKIIARNAVLKIYLSKYCLILSSTKLLNNLTILYNIKNVNRTLRMI